jgi:AcrR family transcriptional regulator
VKQPLDYLKVKEEIIRASGRVFKKFGFAKVSMQDISKESGKGRSTLYYYFKNKGEVLDAFVEEKFKEVLSLSQKTLSPELGFISNMETYYRAKIAELKKTMHEYNTLMEDIKSEPGLALKTGRLFFKDEVEIVARILDWAIARDEIKHLNAEDSKFLSETLVTAFRSFEMEMMIYGGLENFGNKLNWMTQVLYKGLN